MQASEAASAAPLSSNYTQSKQFSDPAPTSLTAFCTLHMELPVTLSPTNSTFLVFLESVFSRLLDVKKN